MALQEFIGAASLELDGKEIEITSVSVQTSTGRKLVKTMNRAMRAKGFSRGITTYELAATAVVPLGSAPIDWANIEGAKLTIQPVGGGQRTSYLDCFAIEAGEKYQVEGEAVVDVKLIGLRKVIE
jgi:hypothetical protein